MKLIAMLLTAGLLSASAATFGQKVTLSEKDASLSVVFEHISQQTGVDFLFTTVVLKDAKPVSINVKNEELAVVLSRIFEGQPLAYTMENRSVVVSARQAAAHKTAQAAAVIDLKGRVTDDQGQPVPGVVIRIEGSNKGAVTDPEGRFELAVQKGQVLLVSSMGFQPQKITVENVSQPLSIALVRANTGLDEVVVVGFGTQKKRALTGAIASIATKELLQSPVSSLSNALTGRLPGLITQQTSGEPGSDAAAMYIRGISTFGGSRAPIVLVDGIPRALDAIDPNEVESVSILKDAASTSIYGIQGANGVVLVTTKRGMAGRPKVNLSFQYGLQTPTRTPDVVNAYDYVTLYNEAAKNDALRTGNAYVPAFTDDVVAKYKDGTLKGTDWKETLLKDMSTQKRVNLNISGGNAGARYFVSIGYTRQEGIYKFEDANDYNTNVNLDRYAFRTNVDINVTKRFTVNLDLAGQFNNKGGTNSNNPFANIIRYPSILKVWNDNGTLAGTNKFRGNPVGDISRTGYYINNSGAAQSTLRLRHELDMVTKGLSISANGTFDANFSNSLTQTKGYATYELQPNGTYLQYNTDTKLTPGGAGAHTRFTRMELRTEYQRTFGQHAVTGMVMYYQDRSFSAGALPNSRQGLLARATYALKNKYFVEFNGAYNGSENFPKGSRFGFFPSASASWMVSDERWFMENVPVMNLLKFRGSYGLVGNDQIGGARFLYDGFFVNGNGFNFGDPAQAATGMYEQQIGNPDVTWEKAYKTNIGVDMGFFKGKLALTADVFKERRKDILTTRGVVPDYIGISTLPAANLGIVENKGFDIDFTYRDHFRQLNWFVKANGGFARNKIVFRDEPQRAYSYQQRTGKRIDQFYGLIAQGFFKDADDVAKSPKQFGTVIPGDIKYLDYNNDGVVNSDDEVPIGYSSVPEIQYGFSVGFDLKGFDFSLLFQGSMNSNVNMYGTGVYEFHSESTALNRIRGRWTPETAATATYSRLSIGYNTNNHRISTMPITFFNGNYLRLKNMEVGYTLPKRFVARLRTQNARFFVNAFNLLTWDSLDILDPEAPGIVNLGSYPQQKVFNAGFSLTF